MARNPATGGYLTSVPFDIVPVAPNDNASLGVTVRGIRCKPNTGQAGTLKVLINGNERSTEIAVGETILGRFSKVFATGTTATGLEGLI